MSNIIQLYPKRKPQDALRNIADAMDEGTIPDDECTLVIGMQVYHIGCDDDAQAAVDAVFNMTFGIQRLMQPVVDAARDNI